MRVAFNLPAFVAPLIVVFLRDRGLTMTQVMLLETIFALAIIALEIPSGFAADRIGRRSALTAGMALVTTAALPYGLGQRFGDFVIAELL